MEIIVKQSELSNALSKVQGIVEKKNTVPILSCVLLEVEGSDLFISATDLEISLRSRYQADVSREGALTAPAKKFFEIIRELPDGNVRIYSEEKWLKVEEGRARFKMMSLPKEDFPKVPQIQEGEQLQFDGEVVAEMIDKTSFAMSHDQTRNALNGILWEVSQVSEADVECKMVATDGHRLAYIRRMCTGDVGDGKAVIVPRKAIMELKRLISEGDGEKVEVSFQENKLAFKVGRSEMVTRLLDGQFPDYQQVIPSASEKKAVVERESLYRVVRRISTLSADRATPLRFLFKKDNVTITAVNPEVGEATEDFEISYDGEEVEMGMNARYVMEIFGALNQEKVAIEMNEALSPALIKPVGDDDYRCVVMPMRL